MLLAWVSLFDNKSTCRSLSPHVYASVKIPRVNTGSPPYLGRLWDFFIFRHSMWDVWEKGGGGLSLGYPGLPRAISFTLLETGGGGIQPMDYRTVIKTPR